MTTSLDHDDDHSSTSKYILYTDEDNKVPITWDKNAASITTAIWRML